MLALCVDDEIRLLNALTRAVEAASAITETVSFEDELDALVWAETHRPDVAFLDIQLHTMDGLTLARRLRELHPGLPVVFCTGYESYAVDALKMHIDAGYLLKPIRGKAVQEELDHILSRQHRKPLTVTCFGNFEAYANGQPLVCSRRRAKELLAYLIDRRGAFIPAREVCAVLLPERDDRDDRKNRNMIHQLYHSLWSALKSADAEEVLISGPNGYAVDVTRIDCDYYRLLDGDRSIANTFRGEYMKQYTWAEETCGWLEQRFSE